MIERNARAAGDKRSRDSERRLRAVVDNAPVVLFALDREGVFTLSEGKGLRALGYEPGQVVGLSIFEVYRDVPEILRNVRRALGGESVSSIVEVGGLSFETYYDPLRGHDGEVVGVIGVATDVTGRKRAYDRLAESERRFSTLLANAPAYYYRCRNEPGWPNELVSDYARELTGYTPEELTDGSVMFADLIVEEDRQRVWEGVQAELAERNRFKLRYAIRRKDGEVRHVEEHGQGVYGDDGEVVAVEGVVHDVTERERTEEKLRASESELKALFDAMNDVVLVLDAEGRCLRVVSANPRLLYEPAEEQLGKTLHEVFPGEQADTFLGWIRRALETRQAIHTEYSLTIDGAQRWLSASISAMEEGVLWVVRDITQRKETEDALRESEERFRSLVQNAPDAFTLVDANNAIQYDSPATERILGYGAEERVGTRGLDYVHPDDVEEAERTFAGTLNSSGVGMPVEYRLRHKDGSWRHVEAIRTNLLDDPAVRGVVINYRYVTDRKEAEKALKESEERHRRQARELALLHEVRTALAQELELQTVLSTVVEAVARTYGYTLVSAYLLQDERLVLQHQVGYEEVLDHIPVTRGIMGRVVRTRRPFLLEDVRSDPAFLDAIDGLISEVCVPLFDEGRVVGTLNVESTNGVKLTEDDLRLMTAVGEHVGIAIGQARLYTRVRESEEKFRALIQNSSDLITLYDREGIIHYVSPALERMLGYEPEERVGTTSFGLIHPDDVSRAQELFAEALRRPGIPLPAEVRARHRDGSWRYIEAVGTNLLSHPSVGAVVFNGRDVTRRKEAEARLREAEKRYRTLVERIPAITYIQELDEPSRTTYISPQYEEILGYSVEECMSDPEHWTKILHPEDRERVLAEDRRTNATGEPFSMEYRQFAKDGSVVWIRDEAAAVRDEEGRPGYWIGAQIDITERKMLEERLEYQAFHDPLTDLPNRALFMDRLEHALSRWKRKKGQVAVLFLDVDNLKVVNDTLGHEAGDRLLTQATGLLQTCLRPADTVARLSGDEFAILLEDVADVSEATRVAERVAQALRAPLTLREREIFITASIGIALSGSARESAGGSAREQAETLLRQADLAMYRAKSRGKAHHEVFDPAMNASAFQRLEMGNDLRRALERNEFRVCYQPKMRLHTNLQQSLRFSGRSAIVAASQTREQRPTIVGMEALVRWDHPERGLLSPKEFIPLAEESGLIVPIGRMVLEEACNQARAWQERYAAEEPLVTCVNISAKQFQHPELAQDVARVLQQTGLEPGRLQFEITESVVMEDAHSTLDTLRRLEALGVQLAIDDFGTGYSSLSYLKRFPVSFLKIDRSFVEPLGEDPEDAVIVSGIISLAHTLGLQVVAEGVETTRQLAYLQGLGCDVAQGNYFSEPLPGEAASALLAWHLSAKPAG